MTNVFKTVLYTGVTNDLLRRVSEHKSGHDSRSFTAKYKLNQLVYFEETTDVVSAIEREKQIKGGSRHKKFKLINSFNPKWNDLTDQLIG